jgi:DNA polymerase-3 subunit delta
MALAVEQLHRLLGHGDRHPLVVLATLHTHYTRMLRLDGVEVTSEREAADLLGLRGSSTYPAKKALDQLRRIGHDKLVQAFSWLAQADLDLRGVKDWPDELVMEVLVARLALLAAPRRTVSSRAG